MKVSKLFITAYSAGMTTVWGLGLSCFGAVLWSRPHVFAAPLAWLPRTSVVFSWRWTIGAGLLAQWPVGLASDGWIASRMIQINAIVLTGVVAICCPYCYLVAFGLTVVDRLIWRSGFTLYPWQSHWPMTMSSPRSGAVVSDAMWSLWVGPLRPVSGPLLRLALLMKAMGAQYALRVHGPDCTAGSGA